MQDDEHSLSAYSTELRKAYEQPASQSILLLQGFLAGWVRSLHK